MPYRKSFESTRKLPQHPIKSMFSQSIVIKIFDRNIFFPFISSLYPQEKILLWQHNQYYIIHNTQFILQLSPKRNREEKKKIEKNLSNDHQIWWRFSSVSLCKLEIKLNIKLIGGPEKERERNHIFIYHAFLSGLYLAINHRKFSLFIVVDSYSIIIK